MAITDGPLGPAHSERFHLGVGSERGDRGQALARVTERLITHPGRGGCGVGAVAEPGAPSREVVSWALEGLGCMEHRGGCLASTGDGAGLLVRPSRAFFERFLAPGRHLHPDERLSVGVLFFPPGEEGNLPPTRQEIDFVIRREGLNPLGWRRVPVREDALGEGAHRSRKDVWQLLIGSGMLPEPALPRAFFRVKSRLEHHFRDLYVSSLSPETVVYKAMATGAQLAEFYPDLQDPDFVSDLAIFHRRYSTNTFSNWYLAQPFRILGHNGEINTIKAARSEVRNLEAALGIPGLLMHQGSDSADLDRMIELLVVYGVPLPEAMARVLSGAWDDSPHARPALSAWQEAVRRGLRGLSAWEGPAAVVASDGRWLVGGLDRMGLRPLRYAITRGGRVVIGSEMGAVPIPPGEVAETGQLDPGELIAVDLLEGKIVRPAEMPAEIVSQTLLNVEGMAWPEGLALGAEGAAQPGAAPDTLVYFGWTAERVRATQSMAREGKEPLSSMGNDRPLAALSPARPLLTKYFRQIIAVVTNPPIDPIREGGALDLRVRLGRAPRLSLDLPEYKVFDELLIEAPCVDGALAAQIVAGGEGRPRALVVDATYNGADGARGVAAALAAQVRSLVSTARRREAGIIVLSDRGAQERGRLPLPTLLLVSALHEALTEAGLRREVGLVAEVSDVQEGHDAAVYLACGADVVHPWLFLSVCRGTPRAEPAEAEQLGVKALNTAVARIMSKMGITTLAGYRGSRLFEAVGVAPALVDYYLPGITSRLGGLDLRDLHEDAAQRAEAAQADTLKHVPKASETSVYRKEVWHELQLVSRGSDPEAWGRFRSLIDETPPVYLRDLLQLRPPPGEGAGLLGSALGEEEVAPPEWIVATTFRAAAMSHGALHRVAHRAIAGAFNRFGSRSNSGEGGEDERRDRGGAWAQDRSRIRQVASGRFGVDARYLIHADELDIKIGQGAKPGEGGHLPGHKVTAEIAAIRKTKEGVTLISPPPHHDIYSIEDLAQLVYNLRQINPRALIGVKCPAVTDIGTIAVGVVKAGADILTVSGAEGGTGAASASSIEHAGLPLERALAETHQALVINGVRDGLVLRCDGGIKTGGDVVKLLALGADEVALGTALMIAEQCVFCHGCAKGNCPAGITTQSEEVAERLMKTKGAKASPVLAQVVAGDPDDDAEQRYVEAKAAVERYLLALAGEVRHHLARLGLRTPAELVGRVDLLEQIETGDPRLDKLDLTELLVDPHDFEGPRPPTPPRGQGASLPGDRQAPSGPNRALAEGLRQALAEGRREVQGEIRSNQRAVGASLAGEIAAGGLILPEGGVRFYLKGDAGQALGFGWVEGLSLVLDGYANDTVGEAMSGGRLVIRRPREVPRGGGVSAGSAAGNAVGYGMTGGSLYVEGRCGQRLGVRCSEGRVVCEGAGKYAFEYMTGGIGVVLGAIGGQACSGMTGGVVYLYDPEGDAAARVNPDAKVEPLPAAEAPELEALIRDFQAETGSVVAAALLGRWGEAQGQFLRVSPA